MKNKCYKYFVNCEINVIKIYNKMIKLNELIINIFYNWFVLESFLKVL